MVNRCFINPFFLDRYRSCFRTVIFFTVCCNKIGRVVFNVYLKSVNSKSGGNSRFFGIGFCNNIKSCRTFVIKLYNNNSVCGSIVSVCREFCFSDVICIARRKSPEACFAVCNCKSTSRSFFCFISFFACPKFRFFCAGHICINSKFRSIEHFSCKNVLFKKSESVSRRNIEFYFTV